MIAFATVYGVPVSGNAAAGDTFAAGSSFEVASLPGHGSVTMNPNGTYSYTPAVGFAGTDTFTYRVTDPTGQTVIATETISITPPALIAADDRFSTAFNTPVNGNAALGDTFAPGSTFAVSSPPSVGSVVMAADGTFTYTPPSTFAGTVTFSYTVTDPTGQVRSAVETIVVSQPQLIAVDDAYTTPFNTALNGNAAAGDTYAPGSVFTTVIGSRAWLGQHEGRRQLPVHPGCDLLGHRYVHLPDHRSDRPRGDRNRDDHGRGAARRSTCA